MSDPLPTEYPALIKKQRRVKIILFVVSFCLIICILTLSSLGIRRYADRDMSDIINAPNRVYSRSVIDDQVTFEIQADDFSRHIGQTIFKREGCSIVIKDIVWQTGRPETILSITLACYGNYNSTQAAYYTPCCRRDAENNDPLAVGWSLLDGERETMTMRVDYGSRQDCYLFEFYVRHFPYDATLPSAAISCTLDGLVLHQYEKMNG